MSTSEKYADWIVKNEAKKGTPEFNTVAQALQETLAAESLSAGSGESVLYEQPKVGVGRKLAQSAIKGTAGLVDMVAGAPENYRRLAQFATTDMPAPNPSMPTTRLLQKAGVITPEAEFTSGPGRVADFTTQLLTGGGVNPAKLAQSITTQPLIKALPSAGRQLGTATAQGVLGGSTNELLNEIGITNPIAKALGVGTVMGAGNAGASMFRGNPQKVIAQNLEGVSPDQMRMAQMLLDKSIEIGAPITGAEAIAQVSGNKAITGTQRFVENAPGGQGTMSQFMSGRPQQISQAFDQTMQGISPSQVSSATPARMQASAENLIGGAEKSLTRNVSPLYTQAAGEMRNLSGGKALPVLPKEIEALRQNSAIDKAITEVLNDPFSKVKGLSPNDPRTLIAAKQYLDARFTGFSNKLTDSYDKNKAGTAYGASRELDSFLSAKSPTYQRGSDVFEQAQKQQFDPIRQGPVGQIAGAEKTAEGMMRAQSEALMPAAPRATTPADIKRTVELLRRKDPTILADWTRQNLEGIFDTTAKTLQTGENQFSGPKFAAAIQGNKAQKDNLRTLITEGSGMQAYQGFERLMDVMEAQGQRMPANSATAFNEMLKQELSGGVASKLASPLAISNVAKGLQEFQLGRNSKMLAKLLTDPKSVDKLEELARTKPNSARSQAIASTIIGSFIAAKPEIKEEE